MSGRFDGEQTNTWNADENKLAQVLNTVDIGGLVSQSLFAKGFRTVLSGRHYFDSVLGRSYPQCRRSRFPAAVVERC